MTQAISIMGSLNNGISSQLLANFNAANSVATDLSSSIFDASVNTNTYNPAYINGPTMGMYPTMGMGYPMGMGMGMGMMGMNPLMMNTMYQQAQINNLDFQNEMFDRQANWNVKHAWTNDINGYQVGIKDEEFANKIEQMRSYISQNNADAANDVYHDLLRMAAMKYGKETNSNNRLDSHNCMKARVNELYRNQTGSNIVDDIDQNCKGTLANAWEDGRKGLFGADGHNLSKETFKAIVTDQNEDTFIGAKRNRALAPVAKALGVAAAPAAGALGGAAVGAVIGACGGPIGAIGGAVIGAGIGFVGNLVKNVIS